jgi:hypothetical protein
MGRKPKRSRTPQAVHTLAVKVTGAEKNSLIKAADSMGMSLSSFVSYVLFEYVQSEKGMIPAPAPNPRPTPADYLHSYLAGDRVLMPCGKEECDMKIVEFDNAQFCRTCSFRVS